MLLLLLPKCLSSYNLAFRISRDYPLLVPDRWYPPCRILLEHCDGCSKPVWYPIPSIPTLMSILCHFLLLHRVSSSMPSLWNILGNFCCRTSSPYTFVAYAASDMDFDRSHRFSFLTGIIATLPMVGEVCLLCRNPHKVDITFLLYQALVAPNSIRSLSTSSVRVKCMHFGDTFRGWSL